MNNCIVVEIKEILKKLHLNKLIYLDVSDDLIIDRLVSYLDSNEFNGALNWHNILILVEVSEIFIREFSEYVDWRNVVYWQNLSEDFIREFKSKITPYWRYIYYGQKLSPEFIEEFKEELQPYIEAEYKQLIES